MKIHNQYVFFRKVMKITEGILKIILLVIVIYLKLRVIL